LLGEFFQGLAAPPKTVAKVPEVVKEINESVGGVIEKWGVVGMCWGGKIVSLSSKKGTPFSAVAEVHPAMVDPKDAEEVSVPICMLPSKDEPANDVEAFEKALKVEHHVEIFKDQIHVSCALLTSGPQERVRWGCDKVWY
jgi:dienelactone hydrolase